LFTLKAVEIQLFFTEVRGIYAAQTAGKAKYLCASAIVETGYANSKGDIFPELTCRRRSELDAWASQFGRPASYSVELVYCSIGGDRNV